MCTLSWSLIALIVSLQSIIIVLGALPGSPETHRRPRVPQHSLHSPMDESSVYWKYGGSTVMRKSAARIVPATQSRRGWLWNDYPLESPDWEVEVLFRVFSKPHFGGDGFAIWMLSSDIDPSYGSAGKSLAGEIFGLRDDFKGFGVLFDTYDNDGRRDNPSVFAIQNTENRFSYRHSDDFASSMIRDAPGNLAYKCTADYRNLGKPMKVLLRYVKGVLHVYLDDSIRDRGYKFCLAVNVDLGTAVQERHLAFTAMTGEVADAVEITEITTYYINQKDADINDEDLEHAERVGLSRWSMLYWFLVTVAGIILTIWTIRDIIQLSSMQRSQTNPVYICNDLNQWVLPHFCTHFAICAFLLFSGAFWGLMINLPLAGYRAFSIYKKSYILDPSVLSGGSHKGHASPALSYTTRLYMAASIYIVADLYYIVNLYF